jgi:hypothetical protein
MYWRIHARTQYLIPERSMLATTYLLSAVPATSCSQNALMYLAATSSLILIITSAIAAAAIGFKFD